MFGLKGPNMEIASLKLQNHPILHDLELNFCDENGKPYKNIVFAGENGTGKTTLLELLDDIAGHPRDFFLKPHKYNFKLEFRLTIEEVEALKEVLSSPADAPTATEERCKFIIEYIAPRSPFNSGEHQYIFLGRRMKDLYGRNIDPFFHSAYSKAGITFETRPIQSITVEQLDLMQNLDKRKKNAEIANDIKQTLVDVYNQDAELLSKWCTEHKGCAPSGDIIHQKTSRFSRAFQEMFQNIAFKSIETRNGEKQVIFDKLGQEILLEELSSGEKQIVFRGGFLLKNMGVLDGSIVLIDEPEISMHPRWQGKIFSFYSNLFKPTPEEEQKSQIFFATHSEYVLKEAMDNGAKIIVLTETDDGLKRHDIDDKYVLPYGPTYAEIKYLAFNIPTIELHDELYGYIQDKNKCENVKALEEFFCSCGIELCKSWSILSGGTFGPVMPSSLMTYIRNYYHHPDAIHGKDNPAHPTEPSEEDMKKSIENMMNILQTDGTL